MVVKWPNRLHIKVDSISRNVCVESGEFTSEVCSTHARHVLRLGGPSGAGVCVAFSNRFKIKPVFEIKRTPNSTYLNAVLSKHLFKLSILRCFTHWALFPHTHTSTTTRSGVRFCYNGHRSHKLFSLSRLYHVFVRKIPFLRLK